MLSTGQKTRFGGPCQAGASVALPALELRAAAMSQQMVGVVIHRLLTDEDLRVRFVLDRIETLAELGFRGFELTPDEIDMFMRTDQVNR